MASSSLIVNMAVRAKLCRSFLHYSHFRLQIYVNYSFLSPQTLQESVKAAVEAKFYRQLPDLLSSAETCQNPNPFSFLSTFHQNRQTQVVDEILQSLIALRPRSRNQFVYGSLLACIFESPSPLPLSFAIIKRILQSGCVPVQQTHLQLSSAWLKQRKKSHSIASILLEMQSIGYDPDSGICNYLISSLCAVDQVAEAIKVVKGMGGAGCIPDSESYGIVISALCSVRRTAEAMELLKKMVEKVGLTPRQRTIVQLMAALRSNREMWKAVDMINFLEKESFLIEFESYESVVEGCIECREFILAGKVVMGMTQRGFVPYIRVRQKVVEGLAGIGEEKLACAVRQKFAEISS